MQQVYADLRETGAQLSRVIALVDEHATGVHERERDRVRVAREEVGELLKMHADKVRQEVALRVGGAIEGVRESLVQYVQSMAVQERKYAHVLERRVSQLESVSTEGALVAHELAQVRVALSEYVAAQRRALDTAKIAGYVNERVEQLSARLDVLGQEPKGLETVLSRLDEVSRGVEELRSCFRELTELPEAAPVTKLLFHDGGKKWQDRKTK